MIELLSTLSIWKISIMVMQYDGPLLTFKRFRSFVDKRQTKHKLLDFNCIFCFSTVIAFPFALYLADGWPILIYWFGLAGAAYLLDELLERL